MICEAVDTINLSASGSNRRIFIVEVMGKKCGFLATLAGLAVGADASYIYEHKIKLSDLVQNIERLKKKMSGPCKKGIILLADGFNKNYDLSFFEKLYSEEGEDLFDVRTNILGHTQQGHTPSPYDRILSIKMGALAIDYLIRGRKFSSSTDNCTDNRFGIIGNDQLTKSFKINTVIEVFEYANRKDRIPVKTWWDEEISEVCKLLGHCRDEDLVDFM